jgi:hypothetical protein
MIARTAGVSPQARASYLAVYSTLVRIRPCARLHRHACSYHSLKGNVEPWSVCRRNGNSSLYSSGRDKPQYSSSRRAFTTRSSFQSTYNRSDFSGQGFSSFYDPDQPTRGPLGETSNVGHGHVTPKALRQHLDQFVVEQDRAKVVLSVAVHEHYLRNQENQRRKDEAARREAQMQRKASVFRHPVEGSSDPVASPILFAVLHVSDPTR